MSMEVQAFCWAGALFVAAAASRFGVMDNGSATTLLIVLPVAAWLALSGRGHCGKRREG